MEKQSERERGRDRFDHRPSTILGYRRSKVSPSAAAAAAAAAKGVREELNSSLSLSGNSKREKWRRVSFVDRTEREECGERIRVDQRSEWFLNLEFFPVGRSKTNFSRPLVQVSLASGCRFVQGEIHLPNCHTAKLSSFVVAVHARSLAPNCGKGKPE